jgi:hypothetical protein
MRITVCSSLAFVFALFFSATAAKGENLSSVIPRVLNSDPNLHGVAVELKPSFTDKEFSFNNIQDSNAVNAEIARQTGTQVKRSGHFLIFAHPVSRTDWRLANLQWETTIHSKMARLISLLPPEEAWNLVAKGEISATRIGSDAWTVVRSLHSWPHIENVPLTDIKKENLKVFLRMGLHVDVRANNQKFFTEVEPPVSREAPSVESKKKWQQEVSIFADQIEQSVKEAAKVDQELQSTTEIDYLDSVPMQMTEVQGNKTYKLSDLVGQIRDVTKLDLRVSPELSGRQVLIAANQPINSRYLMHLLAEALGLEWRKIGNLWFLSHPSNTSQVYQSSTTKAVELANGRIAAFIKRLSVPLWNDTLMNTDISSSGFYPFRHLTSGMQDKVKKVVQAKFNKQVSEDAKVQLEVLTTVSVEDVVGGYRSGIGLPSRTITPATP